MAKTKASVSFKAALLRPAQPKNATWWFLLLPKTASAKLPTRGMVTVDGSLEGMAFRATLQPDGAGSHWLKVEEELREAAGMDAGDTVALEIVPVDKEPEPEVPADLKQALSANAAARATWQDITTVARRDWIHWITSGKKAETRVKRAAAAIGKLACGNRRACCFDRSGMYGKGGMGPPEAAVD